MKSVAIVGLSHWGVDLAKYLKQFGWEVKGSTRTFDTMDDLRLQRLESYPLKLTPYIDADPDDLAALFDVDALVINIPPSRYFFTAQDYVLSIQNLMSEALLHSISHFIFISSVNVLGKEGDILNEESPVNPYDNVTHALVEIENACQQFSHIDCDILRLGKFVTDMNEVTEQDNFVHADDCTRAIHLLLETPSGQRLYHLVSPSDTEKPFTVEGQKICNELDFIYQYTNA